jgi:hypothetical protein
VSRRLSDLLRGLEADARREVERQARARLRGTSGGARRAQLRQPQRGELTQVQQAVRRLAERLKTRLVRARAQPPKGTLNVRRTLRRNMSWGGMPMVPCSGPGAPSGPRWWCSATSRSRSEREPADAPLHPHPAVALRPGPELRLRLRSGER